MRGVKKARWLIQKLADANLPFELVTDSATGKECIQCIPDKPATEEQKDALYMAVMFAVGWPECYRTLIKIVKAEGLALNSNAAACGEPDLFGKAA